MISVRTMQRTELDRIREIDRSEHVAQHYALRNGELLLVDEEWNVPSWSTTGDGGHSVQGKVSALTPHLDRGGTMWGAFDGERLVGMAIYQPRLSEDMGQVGFLHVTRSHRGMGIGARLSREIIALANSDGMARLYVSACPTKATVDFYIKVGFLPAEEPDKHLFEQEPEDIHMIMRIGKELRP